MDKALLIDYEVQALNSLNSALPALLADAISRDRLQEIIDKQFFSPAEDEEIAYWFARFISIRNNLWDVVNTAIEQTNHTVKLPSSLRGSAYDWHFFVLAYSAICSLVQMDRFLVNKVAFDKIIQRKLNESFPSHRIERKQYTAVYKALFMPANAVRIHQAHRTFKRKRNVIEQSIRGHDTLQLIFEQLPKQERYLDLGWRRYVTAWIMSRKHTWQRRGASARQKSIFTALEYSGRFVADLKLPRTKKVNADIRQELQTMLQPGDIFVTRHRQALTNLFLPGYWPHAALYVGFDDQRDAMNIKADARHIKYWQGDNTTFEALKDGVRFRRLDDTLSVDAFVVIRPNLAKESIGQALSRAVTHAGKGYNFDFDFFRSDHLVCTEVIYRAYDGIDGFDIPLVERMGRKTLAAEDLLDLALDSDWCSAIAIYGVGASRRTLVTDAKVTDILKASYRQE